MSQASERKLQVLRAVVEDYVAFSEPVGSKAIADRYRLGVSSATIRNDLAALENAGLISQPHTSAGRVPTDAGYRVFVDQLAEEKPLTCQQKTAISTMLEKSDGFDDLLSRASGLIAELTGQIAIVQYPTAATANLKHIELIELHSDSANAMRLLVIVITETGRVIQNVITCELPPSYQSRADIDIRNLTGQLNHAGAGQPLPALGACFLALADTLPEASANVVRGITEAITEGIVTSADNRLVVSGAANIARQESHRNQELLPLLDALEEQVAILRLLAEMKADAEAPNLIRVSIGSEHQALGFSGISVVTADYGNEPMAGSNSAVIGALGPTKINYPATMASLRGVAEYLSKTLPN